MKFMAVDQCWSLFSRLGEGCDRVGVGAWAGAGVPSGALQVGFCVVLRCSFQDFQINYMESQDRGQKPVLGPHKASKNGELGVESPFMGAKKAQMAGILGFHVVKLGIPCSQTGDSM